MCPDAELLSAYKDGEIPEPWRSRIKSHVEGCQSCSALLASYASLSQSMESDKNAIALESSCASVFSRLEEDAAHREKHMPPTLWWAKSIRVPLPLAAAALLAIALVPTLTVLSLGNSRGSALASGAATNDSSSKPGSEQSASSSILISPAGAAPGMPVTNSASLEALSVPSDLRDIESLIRFLDSQNLPVTISVELPGDSRFGYSGPPELIKVSDKLLDENAEKEKK